MAKFQPYFVQMPFSVHHSLNEMLGEISSHVYDDIQLFTNCTCTDIVYDPNGQLKKLSLQVTVCTWACNVSRKHLCRYSIISTTWQSCVFVMGEREITSYVNRLKCQYNYKIQKEKRKRKERKKQLF